MERIILAFSSDRISDKLKSMLDGTGYVVEAAVCYSGAELIRITQQYDEVLVIMGFKLPDMTVNEIFEELHKGCRLLSIIRSEHSDDIIYDEILVLPLPVTRARLLSSVNILLGHIPENKREVTRTAEETKIVERAKLLLMERFNMTEQQAHRFIQKRSMNTGSKFADTARAVLDIDD